RWQKAVVRQAVTAYAQHGFIDVREPDFPRSARPACERAGQVAGAASNVKHLHARPDVRAGNGESLPGTMQPDRHEVVHDVITVGHGMEYLRHFGGCLTGANAAETEVGGVVRSGRGGRRFFHDSYRTTSFGAGAPPPHSQTCNIVAIVFRKTPRAIP